MRCARDDAYVQGTGTLSVAIASTTGGNFESADDDEHGATTRDR